MKKVLLMLVFLTSVYCLPAQNLDAGDIAFIGYKSMLPQSFSFVAIKDIPPGEKIYITDQGLKDNEGAWGEYSETHLLWTAPVTGVDRGTIINVEHGGIQNNKSLFLVDIGKVEVFGLEVWRLHILGDQLIAYQSDSVASPNAKFIAGINMCSIRNDTENRWSSYYIKDLPLYSFLPPGLTNGLNCVSIYPNVEKNVRVKVKSNAKYIGRSLNPKDINNHLNWITSNKDLDIAPCDFGISGDCELGLVQEPLLFFEAQKQGTSIKLFWIDLDSISNRSYVVEKSEDGFNWYDLTTLKVANHYVYKNIYECQDENLTNQLSYYRLRIMMGDGNYHFSEVKPIVIEASSDKS